MADQEASVSRLAASFIPPMALDFSSETPLYRQIFTWFQRAVLSGKLQPGQRVPSTRALAKELSISRIPVLSAYDLLIAEGYLQTFAGTGTCVARSLQHALFRPEMEALHETIGKPHPRARRMISRRAMGIGASTRPGLQRYRGANRLEQFPIAVWSRLVSRHARKVSRDLMGYGDPMGFGPFREVVAEYLRAFRAVKCDPAQIMVTTSPQQALQIAALALLDPKESAWIEEPAHPATHQAMKAAGAHVIPVPVDEEGLNIEYGIRQESYARVALVTPSHQFPLGVCMSPERRFELLRWARDHGGWIIEDDCNSEYRLRGTPVSSLQGLDADGRVIYVSTLTKAVFPALRLGFIVIPRDLIRSFLDIRNATDTFATSVLYQMAMTDFIREGHFSRHMSRMREIRIETRDALAAAIVAQMGGLLEIVDDEADTQLVTLLPPGMDDGEVAAKLPKLSTAVYALSECYASRPPRGGLVIGYANLSIEEIPAILEALKTAVLANMPRH